MNIPKTPQDLHRRIRLVMELRAKGVNDTKVLGAMERVPREAFVPEAVRDQAWEDMPLPIGRGQTISQPYIVASMTAALGLSDRDKVLEIGTGCGYQTAILARLSRRVYSIERHRILLERAEAMFEGLKLRNITAIAGDGMKGWPRINGIDQAPFDKIICTAAARAEPPPALLEQLRVGGVLVIPCGPSGDQMLMRYTKKSEQEVDIQSLMPVRFVPLLPDIAPENASEEDYAAA